MAKREARRENPSICVTRNVSRTKIISLNNFAVTEILSKAGRRGDSFIFGFRETLEKLCNAACNARFDFRFQGCFNVSTIVFFFFNF